MKKTILNSRTQEGTFPQFLISKFTLLAAGLCLLSFVLCPLHAGPVFFPIEQMTGLTNDTVVNVRAVNNPIIYNGRFYYLPAAGTNLTTSGGYVTNTFVPGAYTVTIGSLAQSWTMYVTNNTTEVSAADLSRGVTIYAIASSGISSNGIAAAGATNIVNAMRTQTTFNIGGNAATATLATNDPGGRLFTSLLDSNSVAFPRYDQNGDCVEDFTWQPVQWPWGNTNWGVSTTPDQTYTNWLVVTNVGFGGELHFGKGISNEIANCYVTYTNEAPVTEVTARIRSFNRNVTTWESQLSGGALVLMVSTVPVGRDGISGPYFTGGYVFHVIFRSWAMGGLLYTNTSATTWTNSPYQGGNVNTGNATWTNGVSNCGLRRLNPKQWLIWRDGWSAVATCDGFTNLMNARFATFQHWPEKYSDNTLPIDTAWQKLTVSSRIKQSVFQETNAIPLVTNIPVKWFKTYDSDGNEFVLAGYAPQSSLTNIPGNILWLKGDGTGYANGANVTTWVDQSGMGNNCTNTTSSGNAPWITNSVQNGLPGIYFNGSGRGLDCWIGNNPINTTFVVCRPTTSMSGYQGLISFGAGDANGSAIWANLSTANKWGCYFASEKPSNTALANGTTYLVEMDDNGASGQSYFLNGVADGTAAADNIGSVAPRIGNFSSQLFTGYIFEVVVFNRALSESEKFVVRQSLKTKWGL